MASKVANQILRLSLASSSLTNIPEVNKCYASRTFFDHFSVHKSSVKQLGREVMCLFQNFTWTDKQTNKQSDNTFDQFRYLFLCVYPGMTSSRKAVMLSALSNPTPIHNFHFTLKMYVHLLMCFKAAIIKGRLLTGINKLRALFHRLRLVKTIC